MLKPILFGPSLSPVTFRDKSSHTIIAECLVLIQIEARLLAVLQSNSQVIKNEGAVAAEGLETIVAGALILEFGEDFRMSSRLTYSLPFVGVMTAVLSGCSGGSTVPAGIDYRQMGFCNTYTTPGGVRTAKPNEVFVVYKIDAVDNAKRNADFTFLPTRLYVDRATAQQGAERGANETPGADKAATNKTPWVAKPGAMQDWVARLDSRRFISNDTSFAQAMGVRAIAPAVISHGAKTEINGYSIVAVAKPDANRPVDQISFNLSYDSQEGDGGSIAADPSVVMNKTNAAQTLWPHPDNCHDLALDRVAS